MNKKLLNWYNQTNRNMPWRDTSDPYKIWISEVMLQQTKVETVIPYYTNWIDTYPTIYDVHNEKIDKLLKIWEGLGYYSRVKNFKESCDIICKQYNGKIPQNYNEFIKLKGVGPYIASAVLSIAFNKPLVSIDGNVNRVASRYLSIDTSIRKSHIYISDYLSEKIIFFSSGDFNQAIMDLGRYVCKPKSPECIRCPLKSDCKSYIDGTTELYPIKLKTAKIPHYSIGVGIIFKHEKLLITQRAYKAMLGGLWEFPGGKKNKRESIKECVVREIKEETNIDIDIVKKINNVKQVYSHFAVTIHPYLCRYISGDIKLDGPINYKWINKHKLNQYAFPRANQKIIKQLENQNDI